MKLLSPLIFNAAASGAAATTLGQRQAEAPASFPSMAGRGVEIATNFTGERCQGDSVAVAVAADQRAVNMTFNDLALTIDRFSDPNVVDARCGVELRVKAPQGYSYAVRSATWKGWYKLDYGVFYDVKLSATYGGDGGWSNHFGDLSFAGSKEDPQPTEGKEFDITNDATDRFEVWAPCAEGEPRETVIDMDLFVDINQGDPFGDGTNNDGDSSTPDLFLSLGLDWNQCANVE